MPGQNSGDTILNYFRLYVCHEAARKDEGRPLGVGLQEQAPNHLKLHLLRAGVVSVKEKALLKVSGMNQQR